MKLHRPFIITARLLVGVKIGNDYLSLAPIGRTMDGRQRFRYYLDTAQFEHSGSDLKSGVGGCGIQEAMASLLSFLGAAAESAAYFRRTGAKGDNYDLFPEFVTRWAHEHQDELAMLQLEVEESGQLIEA